MEATVNYNAYDTWLEPYIGWDFKVIKATKTTVWFFMDYGCGTTQICTHHRNIFDINQ